MFTLERPLSDDRSCNPKRGLCMILSTKRVQMVVRLGEDTPSPKPKP